MQCVNQNSDICLAGIARTDKNVQRAQINGAGFDGAEIAHRYMHLRPSEQRGGALRSGAVIHLRLLGARLSVREAAAGRRSSTRIMARRVEGVKGRRAGVAKAIGLRGGRGAKRSGGGRSAGLSRRATRAGRMPAVPGPAFSGVEHFGADTRVCAWRGVGGRRGPRALRGRRSRRRKRAGGDARAPRPRLRRGGGSQGAVWGASMASKLVFRADSRSDSMAYGSANSAKAQRPWVARRFTAGIQKLRAAFAFALAFSPR